MNKPYIEKPPSVLFKPDGTALMECMIQANPQPDVKWYFKGNELTGDRYVTKVKKQVGKYMCTLQIKSPVQDDQGIYKVVASNHHGQHEAEQTFVASCTSANMF